MTVFRRNRTSPQVQTPDPDPEPAPLGSAVDELLKPIQRHVPQHRLGNAWRRLLRRPKA